MIHLPVKQCYSNNTDPANSSPEWDEGNQNRQGKIRAPRTHQGSGDARRPTEATVRDGLRRNHADEHGNKKQNKSWSRPPFKRDLTQYGIEANPGPGNATPEQYALTDSTKICNHCKTKGHIKRNCPKAKTYASVAKGGGKGGKSSGVMALEAATREAVAKSKGDEDARREKVQEAKEDAPLPQAPKKVKAQKGNVNLDGYQFDVQNTKSVLNANYSRFRNIFTWFGPLYALVALVDWFLFPMGCMWFTYSLCYLCPLATPLVSALGMMVWFGENVIVGLVIYYLHSLGKAFTERTQIDHVYSFSCTANKSIDEEKDNRPHPMSFGPRTYDLDTVVVTMHEVTILHWRYFDIRFELERRQVASFPIAGAPFAHLAAAFTTYKTPVETAQEVRRMLIKASQFDWNVGQAVKERLVERTSRVLDAYKLHVAQFDVKSDTQFVEDWWSGAKPYVKGFLCLIWLSLGFAVLLFVGCAFLSLYHAWAPTVAASFASSVVAAPATVIEKTVMTPLIKTAPPLFSSLFPSEPTCTLYEQWTSQQPSIFTNPEGVCGSRVDDAIHQFGKLNEINPNKNLTLLPNANTVFGERTERRHAALFSPFACGGIAPVVQERNDMLTTMAGMGHRGAGKTPDGDPASMARKTEITIEILEAMVDPLLSSAEAVGFDAMLEKLPYTQLRKEELMRQHLERKGDFYRPSPQKGDRDGPNRKNNIFDKYEVSAAGKASRTIHAMSESLWDADILGSVGRFVKTAEREVYDSLPGNVKHMDPAGIVEQLLKLGPGPKVTSDYSSYEASFSKAVKATASFPAYEHLFGSMPEGPAILSQMHWLIDGTNDFAHKFFQGSIDNLKCSGDFETAFTNWFDNFCTWMAAFDAKGVHWRDASEWVLCEGDDNITDPHGFTFEPTDFANFGMTAKIEDHPDLSTAGFCQKFVNESTSTLLADPIRFLGKKSYFDSKYKGSSHKTMMSLARATAMSALATMPNAPVVSEWAYRVIEMTEGVTVRKAHLISQAAYGQLIDSSSRFTKPIIQESDRLMVSAIFDFSIEQQAMFTEAVTKWTGDVPLQLPLAWFPESWAQFHNSYASNAEVVVAQIPERYEKVLKWLQPHITKAETQLNSYADGLGEFLSNSKIESGWGEVSLEAPSMDPGEGPDYYL